MSKQQPNQDHYKIAGRAQSDGPDRMETGSTTDKQHSPTEKNEKHPAVMRSKKK